MLQSVFRFFVKMALMLTENTVALDRVVYSDAIARAVAAKAMELDMKLCAELGLKNMAWWKKFDTNSMDEIPQK